MLKKSHAVATPFFFLPWKYFMKFRKGDTLFASALHTTTKLRDHTLALGAAYIIHTRTAVDAMGLHLG